MELNLASSITHNIPSSRDSCGQLIEGFNPRVQLRETRSAYFIDVNLSGFRKEDIRLEMDNTRALMIRGQRYIQDMGKVEWTWHLMESGGRSFRRPFRIPHNVNVGTITGRFHQGVLHVLMPKFRWTSRFTPYHINRSDSQDAEPGHSPDVSNFPQEGFKENQGDVVAQKMDDFVSTQSTAPKEADDVVYIQSSAADDGVAQKKEDLMGIQSSVTKEADDGATQKLGDDVGTQSSAADDGVAQKMDDFIGTQSSVTKETDNGVAQKMDDDVSTQSSEADDGVAKKMDDLMGTLNSATKKAEDGVAQKMEDLVGTQNGAAKEVDDGVAQKMVDLVGTQSNAPEEANDVVARKIDDLVGTQSNVPKGENDGVAQKMDDLVGMQSNALKEADDGVARKMDDVVHTQSNAAKEADDGVAQKIDDLVGTQSNAPKEADDGVVRKMDDLVSTQSNAAKETDNDIAQKMDYLVDSQSNAPKEADDQKAPAINTVEEQSIPRQSMGLPKECPSGIFNTHLQLENNDAATIEESPQQSITAPDHDHEEPPCLGSKDQVGPNEEEQIDAVEDVEKKDDQHTQQKNDASSPPCEPVGEGLTAHQETACPLNSEAEEDNHEKHESEKLISYDDYTDTIFHRNNSEPFWSRTKIVVSFVVSSVLLMVAFKWMRR